MTKNSLTKNSLNLLTLQGELLPQPRLKNLVFIEVSRKRRSLKLSHLSAASLAERLVGGAK
jgi:hypothetical protein